MLLLLSAAPEANRLALALAHNRTTRAALLLYRWPMLAGLTVGILLSAVGSRLLHQAHLVGDVILTDPWASGSMLLLFVSAVGAILIPALRAAYAAPWLVLRND